MRLPIYAVPYTRTGVRNTRGMILTLGRSDWQQRLEEIELRWRKDASEGTGDYACGGWYVRASDQGLGYGSIPCKRWDCENPSCAPAKLKYYYALMCNGLGVRAGEPVARSENVTLLTLTTDPKKWNDKAAAWDAFGYTFKKLRERIYYHYGNFSYIAVVEATKSGLPHIHVVCRGLTPPPQGWHEEYQDERGRWHPVTSQSQKQSNPYRIVRWGSEDGRPTLSEMADGVGFGFVCDVRSVKFDNDKGAANYLLGYLQKSMASAWYPPNFRRVRWSRDWPTEEWRPTTQGEGEALFVESRHDAAILYRYIVQSQRSDRTAATIIQEIKAAGVRTTLNRIRSHFAPDAPGVYDIHSTSRA